MTHEERLQRALLDAIGTGDTQAVRNLVSQGANLKARDEWQRTPLIHAALYGINGAEIVKTLVELGADVNAQNNNGMTALMEALHRNDTAMVRALVACGADPTIRNRHGMTAESIGGERLGHSLGPDRTGRNRRER